MRPRQVGPPSCGHDNIDDLVRTRMVGGSGGEAIPPYGPSKCPGGCPGGPRSPGESPDVKMHQRDRVGGTDGVRGQDG